MSALSRCQDRYDALEPRETGINVNDLTAAECVAYVLSDAGRRDPAVDTQYLLDLIESLGEQLAVRS